MVGSPDRKAAEPLTTHRGVEPLNRLANDIIRMRAEFSQIANAALAARRSQGTPKRAAAWISMIEESLAVDLLFRKEPTDGREVPNS